MDNKLIHMPRLLCEPSNAITTLLGSTEFVFEERVILCADYGEVVGHCRCVVGSEAVELGCGGKGGSVRRCLIGWRNLISERLQLFGGRNVECSFHIQQQHNVRSIQAYKCIIRRSSLVRFYIMYELI